VTGLSIDLNLPTLVPLIFTAYGVSREDERSLAAALAHRDTTIVAAAPKVGPLLTQLLNVAGPAESAVEKLARIALPAEAEPTRARLTDTVRLVRQAAPGLKLTVDPLERQGFEYQTGLSFTLFARGARRELGRGGRYRVGGEPGAELRGEPAVGFSLFADAILKAAPVKPAAPRVYLPFGAQAEIAQALRAKNMITVSGLAPVADAAHEARRLGCQYVLTAGSPEPVAVG